MSEVSIYPHIKELKSSQAVPFYELMLAIKGDKWKIEITALRNEVALGATKKELAESKNKLPYFTGSGVFTERRDSGLVKHSGKIVIDFDNLEKYTTVEEAKAVLKADKYTEYMFLSCSGNGIAVVVNINPGSHLDSFLFLERYYKEHYGLIVDKSCKDVSRPRYISHDPDLYTAPLFETVKLIDNSLTVDSDEGRFDFVLRLHDKKEQYVVGNRHNYLVVLAYFLNKAGVSEGYALSELVRRFSNEEKSPEEISKIVAHCYKNTVDHGIFTITKQVKDLPPEYAKAIRHITSYAHGVNKAGREWNDTDVQTLCAQHYINAEIVKGIFKSVFDNNKELFGLDEKSEIYKIELFIKSKYEILKNVVTQRTEYRPKGSDKPFDILNSNTIYRQLQAAEFKYTLDKLKSLLRSDFVAEYNPFEVYFNNLPEADADKDHINALADHIQTDNQEFWRVQFKKALVRSIACTIGGRENRIVMTLVEANQNTGKTSFIRFLCPPQLDAYYTEIPMSNDKDTEISLSENFIWNLEELAVLHNNEINKLKAIISRSMVKQRRPYAEFAESNPRRVNFWASTNRAEFLTDDQNTRWLCFNVKSISHDYDNRQTGVKNIDINKVWAQAMHLYRTGFNYNLTKDEAEVRDLTNKLFETSSIEKDLIQIYFTPCPAGSGEFRTCTDILSQLINLTDNKFGSKISIIGIGRALKQLGFESSSKKIGTSSSRVYWVKEKFTAMGNKLASDENTSQLPIFEIGKVESSENGKLF